MLKVLVANQNGDENLNLCNILSENKDIRVISSYTGKDTLDKYMTISPQVLILDSDFEDISYIEIINRLSKSIIERKNCNIIITFNENKNLGELTQLSKIWSKHNKPLNYKNLLEDVNILKSYYEIPNISQHELDSTLLDLNFHIGSDGAKYMKSAIFECYYDYPMFHKLDDIYKIVADEKNKTIKEVRDGMRSSLIPVNQYRNFNSKNIFLSKFQSTQNISTKYFLDVFVTSLIDFKNKENKENK